MTISDSCVFCRIIRGDLPAQISYQNDHVLAVTDLRPVAPVHLLVIPKIHIASLEQFSSKHNEFLIQFTLGIQKITQNFSTIKSNYRLIINSGNEAGQEVEHLHAHILSGRCFTWPPG